MSIEQELAWLRRRVQKLREQATAAKGGRLT